MDGKRKRVSISHTTNTCANKGKDIFGGIIGKKKESDDAEEKQFFNRFENVFHKIWLEKSFYLREENREGIKSLLDPISTKLEQFGQKISQYEKQNGMQRNTLRNYLYQFHLAQQKINEEVAVFTKSLSGSPFQQGEWGEWILENLLKQSGLERGREYFVQKVTVKDGKSFRPDILVKMPEGAIIIDAKISLTAFQNFSRANKKEDRQQYLKQYLISIKRHIKCLKERDYTRLYEIDGLDFILLFMPLEDAFSLAMRHDMSILERAYECNIIVTSPTTLLSVLRMVSLFWKQEKQSKNALKIAAQAESMYEKMVGFLENFKRIGKQINNLSTIYETAEKQLTLGHGNLLNKADQLRKLGIKTNKKLPIFNEENNGNAVSSSNTVPPTMI